MAGTSPDFPTAEDWARAGGPGGAPLVLIDGTCVLCHAVARFVLRYERGPRCLFAALDSEFARDRLRQLGLAEADGSTVLLLWQGQCLQKSDAALLLCRWLRWPWSMARFARFLPGCVRDAAYNLVAQRRKALFGSTTYCQPLTEAERARCQDAPSSY
jgi:predicted DCC family thiol-disulfide oxidoreductase YuxK